MRAIMNRIPFVAVLMILLVSSSMATAEEYPYIYKGIRPMGMGGAFVAVSNDGNALFYNPAGLTDVQERKVTLLPLEVQVSEGGIDAYRDAADVDWENMQEVASFLRDYIGEPNHASVTIFPYMEKPNLAFGFFGTVKANFMARDYQYPKLKVNSVADAGVALGYAHAVNDELSIGANGKFVMRKSLNRTYTLPEITSGDFDDRLEDDAEDGSGVLIDLGALYRFGEISVSNSRLRPQVGMTVSNLLGSDMGDAEDLPVHVDLGFALRSDAVTIAFDYVDLLENFDQDSDIPKRIRVGAEYVYNQKFAFRAGFYQGYPTFGFGLIGNKIQLDLLSYAEEVGTYSGQRDDRRYAFRFALGF